MRLFFSYRGDTAHLNVGLGEGRGEGFLHGRVLGKLLLSVFCWKKHGSLLRTGGPKPRSLSPPPPDVRRHLSSKRAKRKGA